MHRNSKNHISLRLLSSFFLKEKRKLMHLPVHIHHAAKEQCCQAPSTQVAPFVFHVRARENVYYNGAPSPHPFSESHGVGGKEARGEKYYWVKRKCISRALVVSSRPDAAWRGVFSNVYASRLMIPGV